jgi:hypothetical protein
MISADSHPFAKRGFIFLVIASIKGDPERRAAAQQQLEHR